MKTFGLDLVFYILYVLLPADRSQKIHFFLSSHHRCVELGRGILSLAFPGISCCPDVCVTLSLVPRETSLWAEFCFLVLTGAFLALLQCSVSTVSCEGSPSRTQTHSWARGGHWAQRKAAALGKRPVVEFSFSFQLWFCESPVRKGASPETPSFPDRLVPSSWCRSFPDRPASSLQSALETRSLYFSAYPFSSMLSLEFPF